MIEKNCLMCGGHVYTECSVVSFGELLAGAMDLPDLTGQRDATRAALEMLESDGEYE